jgi:hypothetical protein
MGGARSVHGQDDKPYKILVRKPVQKRWGRWKYTINTDLK